jgi:hypothetical protein
LKVLVDNLSVILFAIFLVGGYLLIRLRQRRTLGTDDLLVLVWQCVAASLTTTYIVGTFDYFFSQSAHFDFSKNDIGAILIPGLVCIAILAGSVYYKYVSKSGRRGKK